jgi:hypothetical protein
VTIFTTSFSRSISIMLNQIPFTSAQSFSKINKLKIIFRKQMSFFSRKELSKNIIESNPSHVLEVVFAFLCNIIL